ncbi:hypothetical protein GXW78_09810 [Roseomonas terrae]|uniref:Phage holin family protein n=1 Tax=Neoroseomonas terrae TaxID=424799 RepID=A0ABS5EG20_9PROT|nr:hypothetical protein [Neoroseomonas terrae]MBR0649958.1 hypothetical protein [Neoroseomonas terrae]
MAAEAQAIYVRRKAAAAAVSAAWLAAGAVFAVAALIALHVALAALLGQHFNFAAAVGIVAAIDIVVAGGFIVLARRRDPIAEEARQVRQQALMAARKEVPLGLVTGAAPLVVPIAASAIRRWGWRGRR